MLAADELVFDLRSLSFIFTRENVSDFGHGEIGALAMTTACSRFTI